MHGTNDMGSKGKEMGLKGKEKERGKKKKVWGSRPSTATQLTFAEKILPFNKIPNATHPCHRPCAPPHNKRSSMYLTPIFLSLYTLASSFYRHHFFLCLTKRAMKLLCVLFSALAVTVVVGVHSRTPIDKVTVLLHRDAQGNVDGVETEMNTRLHTIQHRRVVQMVEATKARARSLKKKNKKTKNKNTAASTVTARGYGAYSITLTVGTPAQSVKLVLDTGSDLVWMPCTFNYTCLACDSSGGVSDGVFIPSQSTSRSLVTCADGLCGSLHGPRTTRLCKNCTAQCSSVTCPAYGILYGRGTTLGLLLKETLTVPFNGLVGRQVEGFGVGCSLLSAQLPSGVAGFGRGPLSMPSQLSSAGLISDKFAYCLQSHRYDDDMNATSLVLMGSEAVPRDVNLSRTRLLINPKVAPGSPFGVYYYVGLRGFGVGSERHRLPEKLLRFDERGNGGAIVDSGTTFTMVSPDMFKEMEDAMVSAVKYPRAQSVENVTGLGLCFDITGSNSIEVPTLSLHFKGGADMPLPVSNYFNIVAAGPSVAICLTILSSNAVWEAKDLGPSVIIGNYQQQNFYILYDRENQHFGFARHIC